MKRRLFAFALAALTIGLLGSCSKINERIDDLDQRVGNIENEKIASIENQIAAINSSIADLGTIRQDILDLQVAVGAKGEDIAELKAADEALGKRIDELQTYVDTKLAKYATTEWANATFATLEQHQWTCDTIAKIDARIGALDAKLSQSISGLESSLKQWVNEQLDAYYTAAQMDAKLDVMRNDINNAKAQGKIATDKADSLATELTELKKVVDTAKATIRTEYKNAIDVAINKLDGEIRGALLDSVAAVNGRIEALDTRVTTLELKMQAVEGRVDKLEAALGAYTELQGTITEIIKKLLAEVEDKPQSEQDTTIWKFITALQAQCGTFGTAIETLQGLVGSKNVATQISEAIAELVTTQKLEGLADAVSALKDIVYGKGDVKSLTQQIADVNEKLSTTYVTKTQLGQDIATAKADLQRQIDSLCNVIGKDGTSETATGIFKKIADLNAKVAALEAVNITIGSTKYTKWSDAVQAVLNKVNALGIGNINGLQDALNDLDARLDKIEAMIQSVTILPAYTDGSVEADDKGMLTIDFVVSPAAAVKGVTKDGIKVLVHEANVQTKAASYTTIPVASADVNEATGDVTITADISKITPAEGKGLTVAVNIRNGLSDFTSGTVPVYVAGPVLPAGALSGVFSVSATKKVYFSKGNLIATINNSGTPTAWKFSAHQYDCLGKGGANETIGATAGDVDLFGWSTSTNGGTSTTNNYGIKTSKTASDYSGDFYDWGKAVGDGNTWRTLSKDEWTYLFNTRTVNGGNGAGKSYSLNITYGGKMGVVLYPDDYTGSVLSGTVDSLPEGVVFLPAAGNRDDSLVGDVGITGLYWSSTDHGDYSAENVVFNSSNVYLDNSYQARHVGFSVRLITESN